MSRINITNFGPIKSFDMEIKRLNIFIGPQASGKSTIAKTIFFCKGIKDDMIQHILNIKTTEENKNLIRDINKNFRRKFMAFFGTSKHMGLFKIKYDIGNGKSIEIKNSENGYIQIIFNDKITTEIKKIQNIVDNFLNDNKNDTFNNFDYLSAMKSKMYFENIKNSCEKIFEDTVASYYIPAGRSLLTILSEQLGDLNSHKIDYTMKTFIENIKNLKSYFNSDLKSLVEDVKMMTSKKIKFDQVDFAISQIEKILQGRYVFENGEEKIYFNQKEFVKISFSSSGQQEAIWILLLIFYFVLHNTSVFVVVEEPEAHLYPQAQKEILELIILLANMTNNQVFITTHSPYILSALNNLLYAKNIVNETNKSKVSEVVNEKIWFDIKNLNTFYVDKNNGITNIIDKELNLIQVENIDGASNSINTIYDELSRIKYAD